MANTCVEELMSAFKGLSKKEAEDLVGGMSKARREAFMDGLGNPQSQFRAKAQSILNEYRRSVLVQKAEALQNVAKRQEVLRIARQFGQGPDGVAEGLDAVMAGSARRIEGGSNSIDARQHAIKNILFTAVADGFEKAEKNFPGLRKIAASGQMDREVMLEWQQLNTKDGNVGVTKNPQALEIAKIYKNLEDQKYGVLNSAGSFKRRLEGFAGSVSHDPLKVGKDFETWYNDIMPKLDYNRTFKSDFFEANPREMLKGIWEDIRDGRMSGSKIDAGEDKLITLIGMPASFSKRLQRSRVLHFTDAGAQFDYHQAYGADRSLFEQQLNSVVQTGRDAGLMSVLGTNPEATLQVLRASEGLAGDKYKWLDNRMAELTGKTMRPGETMKAQVGAVTRMALGLSKMGSAVLSSFPDMAIKAQILKNNTGDNYLGAWGKSLEGFFQGLASSEYRNEAMRLTGVGAEHMVGVHASLSGALDSVPGAMSKAQQLYYKLNGLHYWTQAHLQSAAAILSNALGERADLLHGALPEKVQTNLSRYKIGAPEWELIRSSVEAAEDGRRYASFGDVRDMPSDKVVQVMKSQGLITDKTPEAAIAKMAKDFQTETSIRLATYFSDQSRIAQLEPGARERAMLLRGTSADTAEGQAWRFFAQFKAYPLAMVNKALPEIGFENGAHSWKDAIVGGQSAKMALASTIAGLTALGYVARATKQMVSQGSLPDPTRLETWNEAFLQGGAGGLYGDALLGEYDSRHGKNLAVAFGGPGVAFASDLADLKTKILDPKVRDNTKKAAALRFVVNNTPGANLPYVKAAMDRLFLYNLQESLNPGFQARMEARMKNKGAIPVFGSNGGR